MYQNGPVSVEKWLLSKSNVNPFQEAENFIKLKKKNVVQRNVATSFSLKEATNCVPVNMDVTAWYFFQENILPAY
jgi:hypothetical protein